ncbi:hypothetical protein C8J57DRAFT_109420 [Mycena rebaudengoi]|nr:hypothetical protein C8J57DRAFT_109420 [Mycena rebaudengoi]
MFVWDKQHHDDFCKFIHPSELSCLFTQSSRVLHMLQTMLSNSLLASPAACRLLVAQIPEFARIFQARLLLFCQLYRSDLYRPILYQVRLLLGVSWDNMLAALSAVRSIIDRASHVRVVAGTITILALVLELYPAELPRLISDLGCGLLHLIQQNGSVHAALYSESNNSLSYRTHRYWGTFIRCSPKSSTELLSQLHKFVPPWDLFTSPPNMFDMLCPEDFYNVLQWLKSLPDPPLELIERWQGYLKKSRLIFMGRVKERKGQDEMNDERLEMEWRQISQWMVGFSKLSPTWDREQVIRYCKRLAEEMG